MLTADVHAFVRASLPRPPARVLEVGAGDGELAAALATAGYDVVAIDPAADRPHVRPVALHELDEPDGSFAAAVAVVSLHHVEPLAQSCERLAALLAPDAPLVVDEFDVAAYDETAARWWLDRGDHDHDHDPAEVVATLREHLHPLARITAELERFFAVGEPVRGPYLYRWEIGLEWRHDEEQAIAAGALSATGARFIARRGSPAPSAPHTPPA